ncbi:MAG: PAS domain S-box protein [Planctomycetes bacterium]|nr:PAS domain S-box protein [Planctomycetota bacterium]
MRRILDTAMDGIISMDANQKIVLINRAAEEIFGFRSDQLLGQPIEMLIPSRFCSSHRSFVEQFGRGVIQSRRMGAQRTVAALRATGEEFPIEASISQSGTGDDKIFTVIVRDVTEAVRYRQQIEQQSQMLDQVSDAVSVVDLDGRITYWNQAATRLFGWTAAEAIGRIASDLLYRGDEQVFAEMLREIDARKSWAGELVKTTRSGDQIIVEHRRSVLQDSTGTRTGYLCMDIDITARKRRERAAHRSQRLESIGTLAGGIAHDLNNVLTPIMIGTKLLASGRGEANRQGLLETMSASAQRGAELIKQLLAFAGGIRGDRSPVQINGIVSETIQIMEHTLQKSITIESRIDEDCPNVLADATELTQVLMNLSINARDAMPSGGVLAISTSSTQLYEDAAQLNPDARPGHYVLLKVADTGTGMSGETLDRIFDPFFTTKDFGKGTGLGLATVQGIVKSHGGFVNVYSELGRGTTFSVYLPAEAKQDPGSDAVAGMADSTIDGRGRTILLVDDEVFIIQMTASVLEASGYRVITARDGAAAVSLYEQHRDEVDVILLDMMMPGLDGLQTLDGIRRIDPEVPVIACSGLRTAQREMDALERGARLFIPKPYTEEQLLRALEDVLESPE